MALIGVILAVLGMDVVVRVARLALVAKHARVVVRLAPVPLVADGVVRHVPVPGLARGLLQICIPAACFESALAWMCAIYCF